VAWPLAVAVFCLHVLLGGGHLYEPDATVQWRNAEALLEGRLAFDPLPGTEALYGLPDEHGRVYSRFGLGHAVAGAPFVLAARALGPLHSEGERGVFATGATVEGPVSWAALPAAAHDDRSFRRLWYGTGGNDFEQALSAWMFGWTSAAAAAATAAFAYLLALGLGRAPPAALGAALLASLASPLLVYGHEGWSEALLCPFVVGAALAARRRRYVLVGAALGAAFLVKPAMAVLALPALALVAPGGRAALVRVVLGGLPFLGVALAYNAVRFGTPLESGYGDELGRFSTPVGVGLVGLLLSPGRGLVIYAPAAVLGLFALPRLPRALALYAVGSLAALLALYCRWWGWEGGWCYGPRLLVPALPLLAAFSFDGLGPQARLAALVGLVATSLPGLMVEPHDYYQWVRAYTLTSGEAFFDLLRWDWAYAPIRQWWTYPVKETMLLPNVASAPGPVVGGLLSAALAGLAWAVIVLRRRVVTDSAPERPAR